ncbi:uncharacterized protein LOC131613485 [Vicia villosa]|uniref:uncharacterized protein LOC131613485 n=1 Tax=Vicia villosa TaxID=3911 RepID=UPI00273BFEE9|nr:uncharacterized protein LOC131613485 [Vicia villosa]
MAENKRIVALETKIIDMAIGAKSIMLNDAKQGANLIPKPPEEQVHKDTFNQRLDAIYDEETSLLQLHSNHQDEYPMHVAEMLVDSAAGYEYLSMLDGYSGYNQIFIVEEDVSKTAFRCPGAIGTYEWIVMPFGLKNARATYHRAMNSIFHDYIETFMQAGDFMGFVVHKKGIEINQNKTKAIMETKAPSTKKELQSLLLKKFEYVAIMHVPRIKNQEANDLAQIASGYKISREKLQELVEVRGKAMATKLSPSDLERNRLGYANEEEFEVLAIDALIRTYLRTPIIEYLKDPSVNTDRKTKYRALSYILTGNELFKKTPEGILLKCLGENEAYLELSSVHSGTCGAYQAGHKMKWLLFRYGMYWPTMLKDCIEFAKGCQECQIHAGIQHAPASELHAIIKPWPFRGWALNLIGEIRPTSSKGQRYILVGIDYFTKWVEVVSLVNVDQEMVIDFIQRQILYRFGIPETITTETITTDQGSVFTGRKMQEFSKEMGLKLLISTPYYAQPNEQVEAANKVIIGLIKKHVGTKPKNWHKTLDQVLWALDMMQSYLSKSTCNQYGSKSKEKSRITYIGR